jgi:hypothetical protein
VFSGEDFVLAERKIKWITLLTGGTTGRTEPKDMHRMREPKPEPKKEKKGSEGEKGVRKEKKGSGAKMANWGIYDPDYAG